MKVKDIMDKENFCISPWIQSVVPHHGDIRCCNDFEQAVGNLKKYSFKELFNNEKSQKIREDILNNKIHPGCIGCREKEKRLGNSKRTHMLQKIKEWDLYDLELDTFANIEDLRFLDIRFSNLCNLKCRHCNTNLSTSWISDMKFLEKEEIGELYMNKNIEYMKREKIEIDVNKVIEIGSSLKNLKMLEFKGGEPLMKQKEMEELLSKLNMKDLTIGVVTNGTHKLTPAIKDLFNSARKIIIHYSIEASENVFNYIRGTSLEVLKPVIKDTHDSIDNLNLVFRVTQMPYNIFEYPKVYKLIEDMKLSKYTMMELAIENWVVRPAFLNGHVLPLELRLEAVKVLDEFLKANPECHESVYLFRESLKQPQIEGFELFKSFTKSLDKVRGTNFKKIESRIGKYL